MSLTENIKDKVTFANGLSDQDWKEYMEKKPFKNLWEPVKESKISNNKKKMKK